MSELTCAQRIESEWARTQDTIAAYMDGTYDPDERGPLSEFGYGLEYVLPGTFEGQTAAYWRFTLSGGGPADELRFYGNFAQLTGIEYAYLDWYDVATKDVTGNFQAQYMWAYLLANGLVLQAYTHAHD